MKSKTKVLTSALLAVVLLAAISNATAAADESRIQEKLELLRESVNSHDYDMLKPALHDDFTWGGRDAYMSTMIMRQVVEGFPREITAISVKSIKATDEGWTVEVLVESEADSSPREIILGEDYQIRQADIADIQLSGH